MEEKRDLIGHVEQDGHPVLYGYVDEAPSDEKQAQLPFLTVVAWADAITFDRDPEWRDLALTRSISDGGPLAPALANVP